VADVTNILIAEKSQTGFANAATTALEASSLALLRTPIAPIADMDGDGLRNSLDTDKDGDGIADLEDVLPFDQRGSTLEDASTLRNGIRASAGDGDDSDSDWILMMDGIPFKHPRFIGKQRLNDTLYAGIIDQGLRYTQG
jgi:hypothetical protein